MFSREDYNTELKKSQSNFVEYLEKYGGYDII